MVRILLSERISEDMLPLADACNFTSGSFQTECGGRLNKWDEPERAELMAELDTAFFYLYGIDRDDAQYILSTFKAIHDDSPLFPGHSSIAQRILHKYAEFSFPACPPDSWPLHSEFCVLNSDFRPPCAFPQSDPLFAPNCN